MVAAGCSSQRREFLAWAGAGAALATSAGRLLAQPLKFRPLDVHELALYADLVIAGVIREVRSKTFVIELEEPPLGWAPRQGPVPGRLEIQKFVDWTCARRWAPYAIGQRSLFNVRRLRTPGSGGTWPAHPRVLGGGNEGECPISGEAGSERRTIHTHFRAKVDMGAEPILRVRGAELIVSGHPVFGIPIDYGVHIAAVGGLRRAFRWRGGFRKFTDAARIEQLLPDDEVDALAQRSWFADLLVRCTRADARLDTGPGDRER